MENSLQKHFARHEDALKILEIAEHLDNETLNYRYSNKPLAIDTLIEQIASDARESRVKRLAEYIGNANPQHNEAVFEKAIERLAYDNDGDKVSAEAFSSKLYAIYGAVLTGHPVTSKTLEEGRAIADSAYVRAADAGDTAIDAADRALEKATEIPFEKPTLDVESANSIETIKSMREARSKMVQLSMKVGQKLYEDDWTKINYMPVTVATWIPFDWDGRTDVEPKDIMHRRIELQTLALNDYKGRFSALKDILKDPVNQEKVQQIVERIGKTQGNMEKYQAFFQNYDQSQDKDGAILTERYEQLKENANWRLTDPKELIDPLNDILKNVGSEQKETLGNIVHLRSDLTNDGLSFAQIHFRLNATSLSSAIGEQGLSIDPDMNPEQSDNEYFDTLSAMVDDVQPQSSDLVSVMNASQTVVKQMGMISEFDKYIEQGQNVRFLIAETDKAITPLTALYFAKRFGIDDKINISGLCEDRDGQNEFKRLSKLLLQNESYHKHVFAPRENHPFKMSMEADQFGFSDSHRYDGATPAGAHMERAMGQKEKVLSADLEQSESNVTLHLIEFGTGGQSPNRGFHPLGSGHDAQYKLGPSVLHNAAEDGIKMTLETSFQGMDGNIYMLNPDMAFSYMTQSIDYLTNHELHEKLSNDPFYGKDGLRKDAYEFFETVRNTHEKLVNKRGYSEVIEQFVRSVLPTGSRPVKRPKDSGGERTLPRAIQHGGTLSRLSMWSTILDGFGAAMIENSDRFDRLRQSEVFNKQFLVTVQRALKETMSGVMRAEVELYNPKFWEERSKNFVDETEKNNNKNVGKHMKRLDIYQDMISVVEQVEQNAKNMNKIFDSKGLTLERDLKADYNKGVLHGARVSSMMSLFQKSMEIPEIQEDKHDLTRNQAINRIFLFDKTVLDDLKDDVFTNHSGDGYTHLHEDVLDPMEAELKFLQEDTARPLIDYNDGVG